MSDKDTDRVDIEPRSATPEVNWTYEKADLEQGGYYRIGMDNKKMAVILPVDRTQPIDAPGRNARLFLRRYGEDKWQERGPYTLREACERGSDHFDFYQNEMDTHVLLQEAGLRFEKEPARIGIDPERTRESTLFARPQRTPFRKQRGVERAHGRKRNRDRDDGFER